MIKCIDNDILIKEFLDRLNDRNNLFNDKEYEVVKNICDKVMKEKDEFLFECIKKYDNKEFKKENFIIDKKQLELIYNNLEQDKKDLITSAYKRIYDFHNNIKINSWHLINDNCTLGHRYIPLDTVAIYVPGGKAIYPSSVLMNAIPAIVAKVNTIVMATPTYNEMVLACAHKLGIECVYLMGGAHAISAFAYGTKLVKRVDKIVGPGNIYVTLAKKYVYGSVGIDSIAGPSEIVILANENANPRYIAADMLAQAEHDEKALAILIASSDSLINEVKESLKQLYDESQRKNILDVSLKENSCIIKVNKIQDGIELINLIAPEHLELMIEDYEYYLDKIRNVGAIFIGDYSSEVIGDYMAGPSHVLPTCGSARFSSCLSVEDFMKRSSIIKIDKTTFDELKNDAIKFGEIEKLDMHVKSVKIRK